VKLPGFHDMRYFSDITLLRMILFWCFGGTCCLNQRGGSDGRL